MINCFEPSAPIRIFAYQNPDPTGHPFLIRANRMGCTRCGADFLVSRGSEYPYFIIHFVLDGCGFFHVSGKDYLLKKGDAFILNPGEAHLYRNYVQAPLYMLWIELESRCCSEVFQFFRLHDVHAIDAAHTEKPLAYLLQLQQTLRENPDLSAFELSAMYYSFLVQLTESVSTLPKREMPYLVSESLDYIRQHFTEDIPIHKLAQSLRVSHTYLTRVFRQYMGATPLRYINMKRLEYASRLLHSTDLSCEEIAEKAGFYDASHFHRMFSAQFGTSPSAYRKHSTQ